MNTHLPKKLPSRNIISIDIGGTLAKTAFYVPKHNLINLEKTGKFESLTRDTIPSMYFLVRLRFMP
jgi:hypothetical protein